MGRGDRRPPIAVLFAITATGVMGNSLITPVLPDIVEHFGVPDGRAGLVVAVTSLPGIVVAPLIGLLADRHGRTRVLVPCLVLFGLAGLVAGIAPSFPLLLAARFVQGIGAAGLINLAVVLIGDHWDGTERATLIGRNSAVLTTAIAVLPPIGGVLGELGGWRWAFVPYGIGLVTAAIVAAVLPHDRREPGAERIGARVRAVVATARRPDIALVVVTAVGIFVVVFGVSLTLLPLHLEERFGLSSGQRGLVFIAPAIGSSVVALSIGRVHARLGRGGAVRAGQFVALAGVLSLAAAPAVVAVVGAGLLVGAAEGLMLPTLQDLVTGFAAPEERGAVVALFVSGARAGQAIGPVLAGVALAFLSTTGALVAAAAFVGVMVVALAAPLRRLPA